MPDSTSVMRSPITSAMPEGRNDSESMMPRLDKA